MKFALSVLTTVILLSGPAFAGDAALCINKRGDQTISAEDYDPNTKTLKYIVRAYDENGDVYKTQAHEVKHTQPEETLKMLPHYTETFLLN